MILTGSCFCLCTDLLPRAQHHCHVLQSCSVLLHLERSPSCRKCLMRCTHAVIVKASSGPRYVVGCRNKVDKAKLTAGTRVALDMTTLTIMRALPREVKLTVFMQQEMLCT